MHWLEKIACLVWLALGASLTALSLRLELGSLTEPGPGFLPLLTGIMLGLASICLLLKLSFKPGPEDSASLWTGLRWGRGVAILVGLVLYSLTVEFLGYVIATFLLMIGLFSLYDRSKWWISVGGSIAVIIVTYTVFCHWLHAQFPVGILSVFGVR